jgi:hypothetical protein
VRKAEIKKDAPGMGHPFLIQEILSWGPAGKTVDNFRLISYNSYISYKINMKYMRRGVGDHGAGRDQRASI